MSNASRKKPTLDHQLSSSAQRAALEAALSAADGELAKAKAELARRTSSARVLGEQLEQLGLDESSGILAERVTALSMIDTEAESEDHFRERLDDLLVHNDVEVAVAFSRRESEVSSLMSPNRHSQRTSLRSSLKRGSLGTTPRRTTGGERSTARQTSGSRSSGSTPARSSRLHVVATELIETEQRYLNDLRLLVDHFVGALRRSAPEMESELVPNITAMLALHTDLYSRFEAAAEVRRGEALVDAIGSALVAVAPYFSMYSRYAAIPAQLFRRKFGAIRRANSAQFSAARRHVVVLLRYCANFTHALAILEKKCKFCTQGRCVSKKCISRMVGEAEEGIRRQRIVDRGDSTPVSLWAFLIRPVQRLCQYPLLYKEVLKEMPAPSPVAAAPAPAPVPAVAGGGVDGVNPALSRSADLRKLKFTDAAAASGTTPGEMLASQGLEGSCPRGGRAKVEYVLAVLEQSARAVNEKVRKHEDDARLHDELRDGDGGHSWLSALGPSARLIYELRVRIPTAKGTAAANPETYGSFLPGVKGSKKAEPPKRNGPRSGKLYLFSDALLLAAGLPENGPRDSGGDRLGAGKLTVIGCWPLVDVDVEVLVKKTHVEQAPAELPHGASWPVAAKTPRRRSAEAAAAARSSANPLEATVVVVAREGVRPQGLRALVAVVADEAGARTLAQKVKEAVPSLRWSAVREAARASHEARDAQRRKLSLAGREEMKSDSGGGSAAAGLVEHSAPPTVNRPNGQSERRPKKQSILRSFLPAPRKRLTPTEAPPPAVPPLRAAAAAAPAPLPTPPPLRASSSEGGDVSARASSYQISPGGRKGSLQTLLDERLMATSVRQAEQSILRRASSSYDGAPPEYAPPSGGLGRVAAQADGRPPRAKRLSAGERVSAGLQPDVLQRRSLSMPAASPRAHPDRVWSGPVGAPPSPNKERRDSLKKVKLHSERV